MWRLAIFLTIFAFYLFPKILFIPDVQKINEKLLDKN
jgi:hypothetical protein